jgi:GH24 family phage-related lysozyme (muramidase)
MSVTIVADPAQITVVGSGHGQISGSVTVTGFLGQSATLPFSKGSEHSIPIGQPASVSSEGHPDLSTQIIDFDIDTSPESKAANYVGIRGDFESNSIMLVEPGTIRINGVTATVTAILGAPPLAVAINTRGIVPTTATGLNLNFLFGTEQLSVPVTIFNEAPFTTEGAVTVTLSLLADPTNPAKNLPSFYSKQVNIDLDAYTSTSTKTLPALNVAMPKNATPGVKYDLQVQISSTTIAGLNVTDDTATTTRAFEFVGTPTPYVAATNTTPAIPGQGAQPFFWSNPATRPQGYAGYHSYFQMIQDTLNGPKSWQAAANVTVPLHPTTTQPNTIIEAFICYGESTSVGSYNDSRGIPTIGIGMNLKTLASGNLTANVRKQLAADVLANCSAKTGFAYLTQLYKDHPSDFLLPAASADDVNVQGILTLLQKPQGSGGLLQTTKAESVIPVLTQTQEWTLFRSFLDIYKTKAMNGYTAAGGNWSTGLTQQQQALLVDLSYNVGSNYNQMDRDLASGDLVRAAFDLVNAYRTTQGPNERGLNVRTEADLQMLLYSAGPGILG